MLIIIYYVEFHLFHFKKLNVELNSYKSRFTLEVQLDQKLIKYDCLSL